MRNDTYIKVTYIKNNGVKEFHFDYYNKEQKFVGTVEVDSKGRLKWNIFTKRDNSVFLLDQGIENNILETVSYIYGRPVENNLEYIMFSRIPSRNRWDRALEYIEKRGLYVNLKSDMYYNTDYANLSVKRR